MARIILITGGARSGKSAFAEKYAGDAGSSIAYIATAQIYDEEMAQRVRLHRQRRPDSWITFEAPYNAENALEKALQQAGVVLFDCLTLYTSNLLLAEQAPKDNGKRAAYILEKIDILLKTARSGKGTVVFVTNEVGCGIVPDNALAREYRDIAGWVNQKVAELAQEVYLVVSGIPLPIKNLPNEEV
ncbi:hypothetical protein P22_0076 [Propionispora sp. 2/2-37]|uniref:bifunctional adenosylcobinamide kinase/adenosylcobinamide-phosphate guanylyltransferase n=1 Tax=Propionispora sp. 2/2-37 TaxID=1677858 RepID=UPI0006BB8951|nr:bifunctional adenosylcobinamide kinase/adenosylcobinamide-phosphate guanylyltransferase [Propionispora sp. 2/2-37]CUH94014.1 hypothetical protein P22_0076 [Propionispora sp. 2/2-37]